MSPNIDKVVLEKASIICYRLFDVADEISLQKAQQLLAKDAQRLNLTREGSQYLQLPNPPLAVGMGQWRLQLASGPVEAQAMARVFDHGAVSIQLEVPVTPGVDLSTLVPFADELYDSKAVDDAGRALAVRLRDSLGEAIQGSHLWEQFEQYTILFVEKIRGDPEAKDILRGSDLAKLILGELGERPLSEREQYEVTQHRFSYTDKDLVVVDWNSAFVYEPSGSRDIPDILEICNAQLLELRYYDDELDEQLARIYDEIQVHKQRWYSIFRSPYRMLARRVLATLLELSEFVERVENSLKIVADFYLAKVYEAGVRRLRIEAWQASVTRKQQMLAHVYSLLKGEVDTDRALTLEGAIVFLIVLELFLAGLRVLT
jgi:hypothetical protein